MRFELSVAHRQAHQGTQVFQQSPLLDSVSAPAQQDHSVRQCPILCLRGDALMQDIHGPDRACFYHVKELLAPL